MPKTELPKASASINVPAHDRSDVRQIIEEAAQALGFQQVGVTPADPGIHIEHLTRWLEAGYHGNMEYMANRAELRARPDELHPGTLNIISVRMDYRPNDDDMIAALRDKNRAYVSRYALGRDYHKLMRKRLTMLGNQLNELIGPMGFRAFVDSAPILERAFAEKAGLGWIGKNTMVLNRQAGSYFFLGEILTDLPLTADTPNIKNHCGSCTSCLDICPTQAFVGPYVLDARRCISYLTIELDGPIPEDLRAGMGNRIFGCDDCQIGCPWNRFSQPTQEADFTPRHRLDKASLLELWQWDEKEFLSKTEGMPIRRTGYINWMRNIAVALGNAPSSIEVVEALRARLGESALVDEHIEWALARHEF